jgi:hypothetical protein
VQFCSDAAERARQRCCIGVVPRASENWLNPLKGLVMLADHREKSAERETSRRRSIFSPDTFWLIEGFVAQGLSAQEIADKVGCKLGTLRVKCSQHGLSLRRWSGMTRKSGRAPRRLVTSIADKVLLDLQRHAEKRGVSRANFAGALLETIVRDGLYNAIIDDD